MHSHIEKVLLYWEKFQQYLQITKEEFRSLAEAHQYVEVAWIMAKRGVYDTAIAIKAIR